MALDPIDRIAGRIAQETLAGRRARHPRARIAHFMLADAYRSLVRRLLKQEKPASQPTGATGTLPYEPPVVAATGFLADRKA
jgi:hypothetical protein